MLPTFLIAGAAKSGSSTLYHHLGKHPEIVMSAEKEPAFFTQHWHRGADWYEGLFAPDPRARACGEATVEYMVDPRAPARIAQLLPDVALVFILRDPVERAWSHYWHRVKMGEERRPFADILAREDPEEYPIRYGLYAQHLERFLEHFELARMHVLILEDVMADFEQSLRRLFAFLAVDASMSVAYEGPRNVAAAPRSRTLSRWSARVRAMHGLKEALPGFAREPLRQLFRGVNRANLRSWQYPPLTPAERAALQAVFAPERQALERLLGRELTAWRSDGTDGAAVTT